MFSISGNDLKSAANLTSGSTLSIRVRSEDGSGSYIEEVKSITVTGGGSTGYESIHTASNFTIYPNPSNGIVHFNSYSGLASLRVFNAQGQEVLIEMESNSIDLSNAPKGLYFLHLKDNSGNKQINKLILR